MNKIANEIAAQIDNISNRLAAGKTTTEKLDALNIQLDMCLEEFVRFQELKSLAAVDMTLTLEEAQLVYNYLGESPEVFNRQALAVKVVLTQLFQELLVRSMRR